MKKMHLLFIIACIVLVVLVVIFFFLLNSKKTEEKMIVTKNELLNLINLDNVDCDILSIKVDETEEAIIDNSDSTTIVIKLKVSSNSIINNEKFDIESPNDDVYEHIFNQYSFSTEQFDAVGLLFDEIGVEKNGGTIYKPYEIWWGLSYSSVDIYDMVVFTSIPQNIVLDTESILKKR